MKLFLAAFSLQLRRLLRRPTMLICLLLMPALTLGLGLALPAQADSSPVLVGVYLPEKAEAQDHVLWEALAQYSDEEMRFVQADSPQQVRDMVGAAAWECGYIAQDNWAERLQEGKYSRLFTRIDSPATTLATLVDWQMTAALLDICAPDIALSALQRSGVVSGDDAQLAAQAALAFSAQSLMRLQLQPVNGYSLPASSTSALTTASLVRGCLALVLFLFSCLCAVRFAEDLQTGFFVRVQPYRTAIQMYFPHWAAAGVLSLLAGWLCLALAGVFFPHSFGSLWQEALLLGGYQLALAAFSFLLSTLFAGRQAPVAALPFLMISGLLFCPIVIDIAAFFPAARPIAWLLPPSYYLRAAAGQQAAFWQAGVFIGACLLAGIGFTVYRQKRTLPQSA